MAWLIEAYLDNDDSLSEQYIALEEGYICKSEDGKKFQKECKEKCKELNAKYGKTFKQRLVAGLNAHGNSYNKRQLNEMLSWMKSKLHPFWSGRLWQTYYNGAAVDADIKIWGIIGNKLYYTKFHMTPAIINFIAMKELDISEGKIPKDVIEFTLKNLPSSSDSLGFTKSTIHLGAFSKEQCNAIIKYSNDRHPDVIAKKVMGNVVFS